MPCVVAGDADAIDQNGFVQPYPPYLVCRVGHICCFVDIALVLLFFHIAAYLAVILQHVRDHCFGGCRGVDWPCVFVHFRQVGKCATVVQVEVTDKHQVDG